MAHHTDASSVDLSTLHEKLKARAYLIELFAVEQIQLHAVPRLVPVLGERTRQQIAIRDALIRGETDTLPEKKEERVAMTREERAQDRRRARRHRLLAHIAAVIEENCRKRSSAGRPPHQTAQHPRTARDGHGLGANGCV